MPQTDLGEEDYFGLNEYTVLNAAQITELLDRLAEPVQPAPGVSAVSLQPLETSPEGPNQDRWIVESWEISPGQVWTFAAVLDGIVFCYALSTKEDVMTNVHVQCSGHAGMATVEHAARHLPSFVRDELSRVLEEAPPEHQFRSESISLALKTAISRFDDNIGKAVEDLFPQPALVDTLSSAYFSDEDIQKIVNDEETGFGENAAKILRAMHGSTATVCILNPARTSVWVASLGDSQAGVTGHVRRCFPLLIL
jgi:hypothetical protein